MIEPASDDRCELIFLVERYLPDGDTAGLASAVDRVASACASGRAVHYLQSTFVPGDETCFCVFRASSIEAVRAVNAAGQFPVDRISAAINLPLNGSPTHTKESS